MTKDRIKKEANDKNVEKERKTKIKKQKSE